MREDSNCNQSFLKWPNEFISTFYVTYPEHVVLSELCMFLVLTPHFSPLLLCSVLTPTDSFSVCLLKWAYRIIIFSLFL